MNSDGDFRLGLFISFHYGAEAPAVEEGGADSFVLNGLDVSAAVFCVLFAFPPLIFGQLLRQTVVILMKLTPLLQLLL